MNIVCIAAGLTILMMNPFLQGAIKPVSYSTTFSSVDGVQDYNGLIVQPVTTVLSGNESVVDIILEVPFRRLLDVTVLAYDCKEHPLTDAIELGNVI